ncbi:ParB/RepB/Spo0J family partition protein [Streptomyces sp. NPDC017941]|uniref:ParB/RepB/Spo0J family partition protein n=1 Tax=unclassified Streptomyces TaxID=2593676 RepID=UPI0037B34240
MAKHDQFDDFFDEDDDAPPTDTRADGRLLRIPLRRLAPNLVNPRTDFGTQAELIDLGKSLARRQVQACPAVSRAAYLKLWPDHAEQVTHVDYVLVTGERRYRGATAAGNPALNCVVDDGMAKDRRTFMEAVVSENVDRQNFNPIEEAYAVQSLVTEYGSNRAVAQHFERVDGWVTQRLLLTHLAPKVQDLVRKKSLPLEFARQLGKLARDNKWDSAEQLAWWEDEQKRRTATSTQRSADKKARTRTPAPGGLALPEPRTRPSTAQDAQPSGDSSPVAGLPYDDPSFIATHLDRNMEEADLFELLSLLSQHARARNREKAAAFHLQAVDGPVAEAS